MPLEIEIGGYPRSRRLVWAGRSLRAANYGLLLSINGWSENVVPLMKQNPDKSIILMEGFDLRTVLAHVFDLRRLLKAKVSALKSGS